MSTLLTFPYDRPNVVPSRVKIIKYLYVPNCEGNFPVTPFVGIELPSPILGRDDGARDSLALQTLGRTTLKYCLVDRLRAPMSLPVKQEESCVKIGVGFYWWMGDEANTQFFGYPIDPGILNGQVTLARSRILRARYALQCLPTLDMCHQKQNPLSLCWAIARKEIESQRMIRLVELFGQETVRILLTHLRSYRSTGRELGELKSFLHKGRIRSIRDD